MAKKGTSKHETSLADPEARPIPLFLDILGYREEGEWIALALEMDVRGYGETFEEALKDLRDLVLMQISFAHFKGQPEMILKPADPVWFTRFAETRHELLARMLNPKAREHSEFLAGGLELPPSHVIAELGKSFALADA